MRRCIIALVTGATLTACGDDGPPRYERREGPRLPRVERRGLLEYTHSLSANLCYPDDAGIARDAARSFVSSSGCFAGDHAQ